MNSYEVNLMGCYKDYKQILNKTKGNFLNSLHIVRICIFNGNSVSVRIQFVYTGSCIICISLVCLGSQAKC